MAEDNGNTPFSLADVRDALMSITLVQMDFSIAFQHLLLGAEVDEERAKRIDKALDEAWKRITELSEKLSGSSASSD